jgi:hypothetical protein
MVLQAIYNFVTAHDTLLSEVVAQKRDAEIQHTAETMIRVLRLDEREVEPDRLTTLVTAALIGSGLDVGADELVEVIMSMLSAPRGAVE